MKTRQEQKPFSKTVEKPSVLSPENEKLKMLRFSVSQFFCRKNTNLWTDGFEKSDENARNEPNSVQCAVPHD